MNGLQSYFHINLKPYVALQHKRDHWSDKKWVEHITSRSMKFSFKSQIKLIGPSHLKNFLSWRGFKVETSKIFFREKWLLIRKRWHEWNWHQWYNMVRESPLPVILHSFQIIILLIEIKIDPYSDPLAVSEGHKIPFRCEKHLASPLSPPYTPIRPVTIIRGSAPPLGYRQTSTYTELVLPPGYIQTRTSIASKT